MNQNHPYELIEEIFKEGPVVVFFWKNEPDWPIEFVTSNVEQLTGYTEKEWKDKKIVYRQIIFSEDLKRVEQEVKIYSYELKLKRWKHKPYRIIKKSGEVIWVRDYTTCIYDENHQPLKYIGYIIDITEQYLHHKDIEDQLEKYFNFFEHHSAPMLIIEPGTGRIIDANQSACRFYGYSKNKFKQLTIFDINTLSNEEIKIRMEQAKNFKRNYFQFSHKLADGTIREVEVFSSVIEIKNQQYLFSIIHDITENIKLQRHIEELNQKLEFLLQKEMKERINIYKKFRLILNQNIFGVGILQDQSLIEYNDYLLKILNLKEEDIKKINLFEHFIFLKEHLDPLKIEEYFYKKLPPIFEVQLKHNREKYFLLFITPFIDQSYTNKIELLILLYDITDKKQIEQEKQEKEKMLLHQSKLAAIGESLSALAHQWRQPLNALSLMLQYIKQLSELDQLNKENLDNIIQEALDQIQFLSTTIDDFKNFFKPDQNKIYFSVKEEILSLIKIIKVQLENHNIEISIEGEDFDVYGYPNFFKHSILNLINNAKDAIFSLQEKQNNYHGLIKIILDSNKRLVQVCDNGGGIRSDILSKIFQPYVSTKKQEGTGLGLYLTYIMLKKMNAEIYCYNNENKEFKGACFVIKFKE
jgi:PAS domain S-box-containing protein